MNTLSYKTLSANSNTVQRDWYIVDAENVVLGRLASQVAHILRGKNKPYFTPHVDCGDNVIILNADKVRLTGKKMTDKEYIHYTGYPGGQRFASPAQLLSKKPGDIIENAVRGMLPKTKLGRAMFKKMFVYTGTEHPHTAQQPKTLKF